MRLTKIDWSHQRGPTAAAAAIQTHYAVKVTGTLIKAPRDSVRLCV